MHLSIVDRTELCTDGQTEILIDVKQMAKLITRYSWWIFQARDLKSLILASQYEKPVSNGTKVMAKVKALQRSRSGGKKLHQQQSFDDIHCTCM